MHILMVKSKGPPRIRTLDQLSRKQNARQPKECVRKLSPASHGRLGLIEDSNLLRSDFEVISTLGASPGLFRIQSAILRTKVGYTTP